MKHIFSFCYLHTSSATNFYINYLLIPEKPPQKQKVKQQLLYLLMILWDSNLGCVQPGGFFLPVSPGVLYGLVLLCSLSCDHMIYNGHTHVPGLCQTVSYGVSVLFISRWLSQDHCHLVIVFPLPTKEAKAKCADTCQTAAYGAFATVAMPNSSTDPKVEEIHFFS